MSSKSTSGPAHDPFPNDSCAASWADPFPTEIGTLRKQPYRMLTTYIEDQTLSTRRSVL